jgi:hypothetical protein
MVSASKRLTQFHFTFSILEKSNVIYELFTGKQAGCLLSLVELHVGYFLRACFWRDCSIRSVQIQAKGKASLLILSNSAIIFKWQWHRSVLYFTTVTWTRKSAPYLGFEKCDIVDAAVSLSPEFDRQRVSIGNEVSESRLLLAVPGAVIAREVCDFSRHLGYCLSWTCSWLTGAPYVVACPLRLDVGVSCLTVC